MSQPRPAPTRDWSDWPASWLHPLIFLATIVVYVPALNGGMLWDDAGHVTRPDLQSLSGLFRIWFEVGATQQYYPLLHSAFWLEHRLWGDATLGYHLVNVLLHATSACLFAAILQKLKVPGAWLAAFLFALHPVCVESVAWICEQKNTLSTAFGLAAALAYLHFDSSAGDAPPSARSSDRGEGAAAPAYPRSLRVYWLATALFALALLTKSVVATLAPALLVVIWWRRGRLELRRDALPIAPWFGLGAAMGMFTAWFEKAQIGASGADFALGAVERMLLAGRVAWFYLGKLLWPVDLIFIYPRWKLDATATWQWLFPLGVLALLGALWFWKKRGLLAGALVFGGMLFPVLGFVNVFPFLFSFVADHFQYLACLGVLAPLAVALTRLPRAVPVILLVVLGALTWRQSGIYRDEFVLYETTLARNPAAWMAHNNLAKALAESGRVPEAIPHLEQALKLRPDFPEAENNLGYDLIQLGRPREAIPHLERALKLQPKFAEAHNHLGIAFMATDRAEEGIKEFNEALRLKPELPVVHFNLGLALARSGRTADAIAQFTEAVRLKPTYAEAQLNWGIGLVLSERAVEAVSHFERALELNPDYAEAHVGFGRVLAALGRLDEAVSHFQRALEVNSALAEAHFQLALALRQMGRTEEANAHFAEAQRLRLGGAPGRN